MKVRVPRKEKKKLKKDGVLWLMHVSKKCVKNIFEYSNNRRLTEFLSKSNGK